MEIWKDIEGYEGIYKVSSFGRVKSLNYNRERREQVLTPVVNEGGYHIVNLCSNGKQNIYRVHRLVGKAFIPEIEGKEHINHIDSDRQNNHVSNLEWCTIQENNLHGNSTKLSSEDVHDVLDYIMSGFTQREVAKILNISRTRVGDIVRGTSRQAESLKYMGVMYG